ncbi:hypothetical protein [Nocardiopsis lambiniae]|uniref:Uncharacterized protein n=1 Tax=Nocardiopsis lambiniae TaxID=3075539 RepID=A0ABU2MGC7_9ACTN|nr:hypothetical protein [Nocardiopsis sp. DSM 44743]MDT0331759.1 hypothetical protein [Nocardiopsis sp. DSM 44743]
MIPPPCGHTALDRGGLRRTCVLDTDHDGDHQDVKGRTWRPPETVLDGLRSRWGTTHRIAWTGSMWLATHRDPTAPWRTHVEPTPEQLEERLHQHADRPTDRDPRHR